MRGMVQGLIFITKSKVPLSSVASSLAPPACQLGQGHEVPGRQPGRGNLVARSTEEWTAKVDLCGWKQRNKTTQDNPGLIKQAENRPLDVAGADSFPSMISFSGDGFVKTTCCLEPHTVSYSG